MSIDYTLIWEDDFNRADSGTVGNGWVEFGSTAKVSISGNNLLIDDNPNAGNTGCSKTFDSDNPPTYIKFRIKKENITSPSSVMQVYSTKYNKSYNDGGVWTFGSFTGTSGVYFEVEVIIDWGKGITYRYVNGEYKDSTTLSSGKYDSLYV